MPKEIGFPVISTRKSIKAISNIVSIAL